LKISLEQFTTCDHNKMVKYYKIYNQKIQNEICKHLITAENQNHTGRSDDIYNYVSIIRLRCYMSYMRLKQSHHN